MTTSENQPHWVVSSGSAIRAARKQSGLTVEELARRAGVSAGLVSQLERGKGNPSLGNLDKLVRALGITLSSLFEPDGAVGGDASTIQPRHCEVVRAAERKKLALPNERIVYELLTPDLNRSLEVIRTVLEVGFDTSDRPFQHQGEECAHVLTGRVEVTVGETTVVLERGDAVTYDASYPHWWRNLGGEAEMIAATTPPSF